MDPANAFSSLQPSCNQGSTEKKQDSQADATAARENIRSSFHTHMHANTHTRTVNRWAKVKLQPSQPEKMIVKHAHSIQFQLISQSKKTIYPLAHGDGLIQNGLDTFSEVTERRNNSNSSGKELKNKKNQFFFFFYQKQTLFKVQLCVCFSN